MKIISKASMLKKKQGFEKQLRENQNLAGLINVDKALYKHWLVQSTVRLQFVLGIHFLFLRPRIENTVLTFSGIAWQKAERRVLEVVNRECCVFQALHASP
jgi:hypothetical protein